MARSCSRPTRMVVRPSYRAGSGREALTDGREWMGGSPSGLNVVGKPSGTVRRPSRTVRRPSPIARSGLEAHPQCGNLSEVVVRSPCCMEN